MALEEREEMREHIEEADDQAVDSLDERKLQVGTVLFLAAGVSAQTSF